MTDSRDEKTVQAILDKHCPPHNAINDEVGREEGFFHCEGCAEIINARFEEAIREAIKLTRDQHKQELDGKDAIIAMASATIRELEFKLSGPARVITTTDVPPSREQQ